MNKTILTLIAAILIAPIASANHGQVAVGAGTAGDVTVTWVAQYSAGDGDTQTWVFDVVAGDLAFECVGFGSIEAGFTFAGCAEGFATAGTGVFQAYLSVPPLDAREISFTLNGVEGSAQQAVVG